MTDIITCKFSSYTERRIYMKVLLIDTASGGHHDYYASAMQKLQMKQSIYFLKK